MGDRYKTGLWTNVELELRGGSQPLIGSVAVTVPDGDGTPSQVVTPPTKPIQVLPGQTTTVRLCVRFGRVRSELTADFIAEGKVAAHKIFETSIDADGEHFLEAIEDQPFLVAIGNSNLGLDEAVKLRDAKATDPSGLEPSRTEVARVENTDQLPTHWLGYEGVDAVAISTSNPEMFRKLAPDDARIKALDEWIRLGGRLVLCVGSQADIVLAENAPFAAFAPGRMEKIESFRLQKAAVSVWEQYCGSTSPLPQSKTGDSLTIRCPKLDVSEGVEAREADLPLIIRTPHGLGQILFVAADLDQPPFKNWNDRGLLVAKLLDFNLVRGTERSDEQYAGGYGFSDLAGQLRSSLDNFTGVKVVPFAIVALMIIAYIILIGPGDYFLLKKIIRRMEWTWITFPVLVVAVSFAAYWLAYYLKGNQLRVNQVDLVDVDVSANTVRGTTWLNIFSPRMESFDLSLAPMPLAKAGETPNEPPKASGYFAWMGLPGSGLGGMNPHGGGSSLLSQAYLLWPDAAVKPPAASSITGVPIQVWSTKSFTGRWQMEAPVVPQADLSEKDQDLVGTITNPYDFPLENCVLAYDRWAYELGTILPGEPKNINDSEVRRTNLQNYLTKVQMSQGQDKEGSRLAVTPFDRNDRDPSYILQIMMFYELVGGRDYARLSNDYQSFVDLSNLLKTNRAILWTNPKKDTDAKNQGAILQRDAKPLVRPEDRHSVIHRFIFPVKK